MAGTLAGGRIADRIGAVRTVQIGCAAAPPRWSRCGLTGGTIAPLVFAALVGVALNIPFAVLVKLGQDYLPGRPGTAAGVTLGLGVSIGGLFAPLLGLAAQHLGPQGLFAILCAAPPAAWLLGLLLTEPKAGYRAPLRSRSARSRMMRALAKAAQMARWRSRRSPGALMVCGGDVGVVGGGDVPGWRGGQGRAGGHEGAVGPGEGEPAAVVGGDEVAAVRGR